MPFKKGPEKMIGKWKQASVGASLFKRTIKSRTTYLWGKIEIDKVIEVEYRFIDKFDNK